VRREKENQKMGTNQGKRERATMVPSFLEEEERQRRRRRKAKKKKKRASHVGHVRGS